MAKMKISLSDKQVKDLQLYDYNKVIVKSEITKTLKQYENLSVNNEQDLKDGRKAKRELNKPIRAIKSFHNHNKRAIKQACKDLSADLLTEEVDAFENFAKDLIDRHTEISNQIQTIEDQIKQDLLDTQRYASNLVAEFQRKINEAQTDVDLQVVLGDIDVYNKDIDNDVNLIGYEAVKKDTVQALNNLKLSSVTRKTKIENNESSEEKQEPANTTTNTAQLINNIQDLERAAQQIMPRCGWKVSITDQGVSLYTSPNSIDDISLAIEKEIGEFKASFLNI